MSLHEADTLLTLRWLIAHALRNALDLAEEQTSEAIALVVVESLQAKFGGSEVYIPAISPMQRYEQIKAIANGKNRHEVCQRFGISQSTYYKAIKKCQKSR